MITYRDLTNEQIELIIALSNEQKLKKKVISLQLNVSYSAIKHVLSGNVFVKKETKTYVCNKCNKEFDNPHKFRGHCSFHLRENRTNKKVLKKEKQKLEGGYRCRFCNLLYKNPFSLGSHVPHCVKNPNCEINKEIFKKSSLKSQLTLKNKSYEDKIKSSDKLSNTIRNKVLEGTWHTSLKKTKIYEYNGIKFHGTWELKYAKWLDENNIKWRRPIENFPYPWKNKTNRYTPDFYLIKEKCYIEIKGYETDKDLMKQRHFPKNLVLKVLKGKDLIEIGIELHKKFT
jgi:hypothetical protein